MNTPEPKKTAAEVIAFNRQAKARKIYDALSVNGIRHDILQRFTPHQWGLAAMLAGYKDGKLSDETRGMVLELFGEREVNGTH